MKRGKKRESKRINLCELNSRETMCGINLFICEFVLFKQQLPSIWKHGLSTSCFNFRGHDLVDAAEYWILFFSDLANVDNKSRKH